MLETMSFCPHCGARAPKAARTCAACGALVAAPDDDDRPAGQTLVLGSAAPAEARRDDDPPADEPTFAKTLMGMPAPEPEPDALVTTLVRDGGEAEDVESLAVTHELPEKAPRAGVDSLGRTRMGGHGLASGDRIVMRAPPERTTGGLAAHEAARAIDLPPALLGLRLPALPEPPRELGETLAPGLGLRAGHDVRRRNARIELPPPKKPAKRRRTNEKARAWLVGAGAALAVIAIGASVALWPIAPALTGRVRADADGRETIDLACAGCPEGARVSLGGATATLSAGAATVPAATALPLGDNLLPVTIERRGGDAEEALARVHVAARLRADLSALDAERPAIRVAIEAAPGASVTIDGKPVALVDGRGSQLLDVADACAGPLNEPTTLKRRISYAITSREGMPESGVLEAAVDVLPLRIDAPGPNAVVDRASFVLAGRTAKGAEVVAAGRPITVRPDGTFAQTMNVSSLGKTRIEVRARLAGKAPRLAWIGVERVASLEAAAEAFLARSPLSYADLASGAAKPGDPVVLGGRVEDTKFLEHQTILTLEVAPSFGCRAAPRDRCRARLVLGSAAPIKAGDRLRGFGHVASAEHGGLPEVQVDFILGGVP
jgi:hypothetical protein